MEQNNQGNMNVESKCKHTGLGSLGLAVLGMPGGTTVVASLGRQEKLEFQGRNNCGERKVFFPWEKKKFHVEHVLPFWC